MINLRTSARFLLMLAAQLLIFTGGGCKKDEGPTTPVITPITEDLFPLVAGRRFVYTGFLVDTNSVETPVASSVGHYQAVWNVLAGPAGTWLIQDSTTVGTTTATRFFQITKDTTTGDFSFRQTLGPFYRAIHATYTDTAVWIGIARPSMGIGVVWTAFDTTVTGNIPGVGTSNVRLQIFGEIEAKVSITDSSASHTVYPNAYRIRTWRKITAGGFVVQDDATTAKLWLAANIGPVQVNISGDTENYGHFRVLKDKNF